MKASSGSVVYSNSTCGAFSLTMMAQASPIFFCRSASMVVQFQFPQGKLILIGTETDDKARGEGAATAGNNY
ncbi:Protein of unknown function [Lactobacillus delbrueckii subsp. bulgaricus]|nr:Protein of unknown function [Lactobacillus delbrueckii subsp. bulgaricus]